MSHSSDQHVVITGNLEVLRYPTLAKAKAMFINKTVIYTSPKDLIERLSNSSLITLLRRYSNEKLHGKLKNSEAIANKLWPLLLKHAKIQNPWATQPTPGTKSFQKAFTAIQVSQLYFEWKEDKWAKRIPPQAQVLMDYFVENMPEGGVTEQELEVLVRQCHSDGILKTRQDPWRIFQYYRSMLFERGFLTTVYDQVEHVKAENKMAL